VTSTLQRPVEAPLHGALDRASGVELLGDLHGSGYKEGAALVRRADGQVVQLGPLMYALLEEVDGRRDTAELASALCEKLGRGCDEDAVVALAQKLAAQGLLAGHEHNAPPRRNPLLALRWKVLVTDPTWTSRFTAPFTFLFRPWIAWPVVAAFLGVIWFVLFHKGVASATSQAFDRPGLLLLVLALVIVSAGFHELGHASACRYGGATPGGMGMGLYLVWPAFYTDVTDAYRLPRGSRLRVDLGGIYFNAIIAVATLGVWLVTRTDALFLLIALQLLIMVKNLSPVIRSDGYHILSDLTGIPDLYAHIGPTLRRLLPWRRNEPSALKGRARLLVTVWVLVVVPVLLAMMLGAILLLPRMVATAWDSGRVIVDAIPHESTMGVAAGLLRLFALSLPALASILVAQQLARTMMRKGWSWSDGSPGRRALVVAGAAGIACCAAWAWYPAGQYQAVQPYEHATLTSFGRMIVQPEAYARPLPQRVTLEPGKHLAIAMIPRGGATKQHPALYIIPGKNPVALLSNGRSLATAFPFKLPGPPGPGGTQALAVNTKDGSVLYDIAYAIVTVPDGENVTNTNSAFAIARCKACTTVAVSFQVVLIVGESHDRIAPIDAAGAVNYDCPACVTVALANQIVITLKSQPTQELLDKLQAALKQLDALSVLGSNNSPAAIAAAVASVQKQIDDTLQQSGLVDTTTASTTTTIPKATTTTTPAATTTARATTSPGTTTAATTTATTTTQASTQTSTTAPTTTAQTTTSETTTTSQTATTTP